MNYSNSLPQTRPAANLNLKAKRSSDKSLIGESVDGVRAACQHEFTGKGQGGLGHTFTNVTLARLFFAKDVNSPLQVVRGLHTNLSNLEGSAGAAVAQGLSEEFLTSGQLPDKQYTFKLINAKTKKVIASDMPAYESKASAEMSPEEQAIYGNGGTKPVVADEDFCAYLHIYAVTTDPEDGSDVPVSIAYQKFPNSDAENMAAVYKMVKAGYHIQAGVVLQAKVANWVEAQQTLAAIEATEEPEVDFSAQSFI